MIHYRTQLSEPFRLQKGLKNSIYVNKGTGIYIWGLKSSDTERHYANYIGKTREAEGFSGRHNKHYNKQINGLYSIYDLEWAKNGKEKLIHWSSECTCPDSRYNIENFKQGMSDNYLNQGEIFCLEIERESKSGIIEEDKELEFWEHLLGYELKHESNGIYGGLLHKCLKTNNRNNLISKAKALLRYLESINLPDDYVILEIENNDRILGLKENYKINLNDLISSQF